MEVHQKSIAVVQPRNDKGLDKKCAAYSVRKGLIFQMLCKKGCVLNFGRCTVKNTLSRECHGVSME